MLAYLVLTGRNGAAVDAELVQRFEGDLPELPFDPTERITWRSQNGTVVFLGWQAFTSFAGIRSHWDIDGRGLTAFTNHCWPQSTGWDHQSGRSWAAQLRDYLHQRRDPLEARAELFGQFNLIDLHTTGEGFIASDYMSAEPLYFADGGDVTAVSNRAGFCARAVVPDGVEPERSLTGAGWLLCCGSMLDEESGYWDVEHLPFGSHVAIDPLRGASIVSPRRSPMTPVREGSYEEMLERVDSELRSTMRAIAELPVADRELALSGGKDSRLLTAVILSEGLCDRFRFTTIGPPEKSDPLVARNIANTFGLDWSLVDRTGRTPEEALDEVRSHTGLVEGKTSAWDPVGSTIFTSGVTVGGLAGEYLRWGATGFKGTQVTSEAELLALLRRNSGFDPMGILRPEALDYYHQALVTWATRHLQNGESLRRVGSFFMQETRVRPRTGPTQAWNARLRVNPYITRGIVQANHGLPEAMRPDYRFHIDLMRRYSVELSKHPFADSTWGEASIAHLPDADDYRRIPPVRNSDPGARNWRLKHYEIYRPMLERYLLDRDNLIHELTQYDRLAERIATGDANPGRTRMLWGALTAAVWMARHEYPARITRG